MRAPNRFFVMFRSGPVSLHGDDSEQVEEKASAEASSSNLDDTTTPQEQNITTSTLSRQDSLKRKVPDDGFDEDNVRTFSFQVFVASEFSYLITQEKLEYPHVSICWTSV